MKTLRLRHNVMYSRFGGRRSYIWRRVDDDRHHRTTGRISVYYGRNPDRVIGGKVIAEYYIGRPLYLFGGGVEFGYHDEPVNCQLYFWPFSIYLNADTPLLCRLRDSLAPKYDEREISLHVSPKGNRTTVRWLLWHSTSSWSSRTPRWRCGSFDLADSVLGRREMRWETVSTQIVSIPMPERTYEATIEIRDHVSWRKRLPFWTKRLRCADVEIPSGIGFPGKGENSWDCGDDATYGMSCGAETVEEAIGKVVASVMRDRMRYGGSHEFTPSEVTP